ncbi:MAG TPA: nucleotide exchange factor GrpE [Stellaceae bacterium]|nr:nucleotide exchange factor GrpE [Stellaceae bacterium]
MSELDPTETNPEEAAPEAEPEALPPPDPTAQLEEELAQAKDQLLRALAEQENIRRRAQRDKEESVKYAATALAKDLISTADNLRRALDSVKESELDEVGKNLLTGVAATERGLLSAFERNGIRRIDPLGEKFDHNFHQALFEVEDASKPAGTVAQVLAPGYTLHDRLLRAAMVGVSKGGPGAGSTGAGSAA